MNKVMKDRQAIKWFIIKVGILMYSPAMLSMDDYEARGRRIGFAKVSQFAVAT